MPRPPDAQQVDHSRVLFLVFIAALQLLLIVLLLRSWYRSKAAESALHLKEQALRKSEEKFSKAFRQGPLALALTTAEGYRYIEVNETYEQLTGYRRDEVLGRSVLEIAPWVDPDERVRLAEKLMAEGHLRDVEFRFRRKDGTIRIARASAELIEIEKEPCFLGVAIDITDRKQAEQALIESEERFRLMADSAPVLMWLTSPDQLCADVNKEWLRFTGRTMQEELGEGWKQVIHPDDLSSVLSTYATAAENRRGFLIEHRMRRFDGEYRWMRNNAVPRFMVDKSFAGYIGCCVDITSEMEAKAVRLEIGGKLIRAQEEERSRIARELHDDINQRLALLANGLENLRYARREYPDAELKAELGDLWTLTSEIAGDIQQLSHRLHPSKLHYLGLATAVRDLCHEFSRQHGTEVECNVANMPHDLDDTVSLSLFRTIQESLRNVAKHSQAHHVKIELSRNSTQIKLRISDDGVGFDLDQMGNHGAHKGLGLISMRERLRSAGGELHIWSSPSMGTQVEGRVPVVAKRSRTA
jgi:PAS domain S-box-containing protein